MANQMITRTVIEWKATAYTVGFDAQGEPFKKYLGEALYVAGHASKTDARAALKANGVTCPKGTHIEQVKNSEVLYGMTLDKFMEFAAPIEK